MRVTVERSLRVTVLGLVAGQVPDDEGLVTATGQEHVGAVGRRKRERSRMLALRSHFIRTGEGGNQERRICVCICMCVCENMHIEGEGSLRTSQWRWPSW